MNFSELVDRLASNNFEWVVNTATSGATSIVDAVKYKLFAYVSINFLLGYMSIDLENLFICQRRLVN